MLEIHLIAQKHWCVSKEYVSHLSQQKGIIFCILIKSLYNLPDLFQRGHLLLCKDKILPRWISIWFKLNYYSVKLEYACEGDCREKDGQWPFWITNIMWLVKKTVEEDLLFINLKEMKLHPGAVVEVTFLSGRSRNVSVYLLAPVYLTCLHKIISTLKRSRGTNRSECFYTSGVTLEKKKK